MRVELESVTTLLFEDGRSRARRARRDRALRRRLAHRPGRRHPRLLAGATVSAPPVRLLPAVDGHDTFSEDAGTKHLKPDLEAARSEVDGGARPAPGSGSTPAADAVGAPCAASPPSADLVADLVPALRRESARRSTSPADAAQPRGRLRGRRRAALVPPRPARRPGVPSASVDLDLRGLLAAAGAEPSVPSRARRGRGATTSATSGRRRPGGDRCVRARRAAGARQRGCRGQPQRLRRRRRSSPRRSPLLGRRRRSRPWSPCPRSTAGRQGRGAGACWSGPAQAAACSPPWTPTTPSGRRPC